MPISFRELNESDALEAARFAALAYHPSPLITIELHPDQGCFSVTFAASYSDGTKSIIQLRDEPITVAIVLLAQSLLGSIVPLVTPLPTTKTSYVYGQPKMSGERWDPMAWAPVEDDTAISVQFANILACCNLHINSETVVNNYVIPRLDSAITLVTAVDGPFQHLPDDLHRSYVDRLMNLRKRADNLKMLDLILCHVDPNPFNVIVDHSLSPPKITGLVDWDSAKFLPFGINACEIRFIACLNVKGHDVVSEEAKPLAIAFWNALVAGIPGEQKNAVLDSLEIGYVLLRMFGEWTDLKLFQDPSFLLREVELFIERMDWFEEIFRPLCAISS